MEWNVTVDITMSGTITSETDDTKTQAMSILRYKIGTLIYLIYLICHNCNVLNLIAGPNIA